MKKNILQLCKIAFRLHFCNNDYGYAHRKYEEVLKVPKAFSVKTYGALSTKCFRKTITMIQIHCFHFGTSPSKLEHRIFRRGDFQKHPCLDVTVATCWNENQNHIVFMQVAMLAAGPA